MQLRAFFRFVEIQTKVASLFPFLIGTAYALYAFGALDLIACVYFAVSLFSLDMLTTGLNNYFDARRNLLTSGYTVEYQNVLLHGAIRFGVARMILGILFILAVGAGLLLVMHSGVLVLLMGMLAFLIAFSYSYGPVPINHTPYGEIASGLTMGLIITFIAAFIHSTSPDGFVFDLNTWRVVFYVPFMLKLFSIGLPMVCTIAAIMLANNICDVQEDLLHKRYTLPTYLGVGRSLFLFAMLYVAAYLIIILMVLLKVLPLWCMISLLSVPLVFSAVRSFKNNPSKKETFVLSVRNHVWVASTYLLGLVLAILFR